VFEKEHDNAIKAIREHIEKDEKNFLESRITAKFSLRKEKKKVMIDDVRFNVIEQEKEIVDYYLLDRDAFYLIVMSFTGKKAEKWKIEYIEAFNTMENIIIELQDKLLPDPKTYGTLNEKTGLARTKIIR
jgi:Rha family phage regulatory protein